MNAVNGATLLILGALLVATLYALRATPRARNATPVVLNQAHPCNLTACGHRAVVITRERPDLGGDTVRVCGGHYAEGTARGWWAA